MLSMRRRLVCCSNDRDASLDFDEQDRVMTYDGLESCIFNRQTYENESRTSRGDECASESMEYYDSSCSSSKDVFGSFSFKWLSTKKDRHGLAEWDVAESPPHFYAKEKPPKAVQVSDVDAMKEKFAKLLLGEDVTGGQKGITTALALSNGITNLAVTIFGELWKLEPLHEERKARWQREMSWLLSPTHYMVELIPTKQSNADGGILEIMTPKIRADIHMNLPALQKLDSMLIEVLDSMVNTEFWYVEGGSRGEGRSKGALEGKKWWLPSPHVPSSGLSEGERKRLLTQGRVVYQVLKAAQSTNQSILSEMPVPDTVKEAICKCGRTNLSEELLKILSGQSTTAENMLNSLNLKSEHKVLEVINRLEAAVFARKARIKEQDGGKSPIRTSWSTFIKDSISERENLELLLDRGEALHQLLKMRHPNLPQSFLDAKKVQHGKDVGHAIMEAYSRVLGNLAFSILSRIGDILQEDELTNPKLAMSAIGLPVPSCTTSPDLQSFSVHMNKVEAQFYDSAFGSSSNSDAEFSCSEAKSSSVTATPSWGRPSCLGKEAHASASPGNSP